MLEFNLSKIIERDKYIIKLDPENHWMEFTIKEGITFDSADAWEAKAEVVKHFPAQKFYIYAEGIEFFTLTKEARESIATEEHLDNVYCVAFYTTNISLLLLGELYNKINKPPVPTKIFSDADEARQWLVKQMKNKSSEGAT
jgi:hypothetical protein